ncbi:MAG: hypothetical protein Ta2G_09810 [Termitinemataceae bacterium]|nr:MAG: hypothetical protein Ta2G_09810 [Termitinemataceae bacterium]
MTYKEFETEYCTSGAISECKNCKYSYYSDVDVGVTNDGHNIYDSWLFCEKLCHIEGHPSGCFNFPHEGGCSLFETKGKKNDKL